MDETQGRKRFVDALLDATHCHAAYTPTSTGSINLPLYYKPSAPPEDAVRRLLRDDVCLIYYLPRTQGNDAPPGERNTNLYGDSKLSLCWLDVLKSRLKAACFRTRSHRLACPIRWSTGTCSRRLAPRAVRPVFVLVKYNPPKREIVKVPTMNPPMRALKKLVIKP